MAAGITATLKNILNKFADTQIALLDTSKPRDQNNPMLGDVLDSLAKTEKVAEGTYDFSLAGGALGTKKLGVKLPAGAIITQLITDALTPMTSAGLAEVAVEVGSTVVKAATAFDDASLVGLDQHLSTPLKSAAGGDLELVITVAALTAGKVRVIVKYLEA